MDVHAGVGLAGSFSSWSDWFMLRGRGYQWWSGFGSDLGELTLIGAVVVAGRNLRCHEPRCLRIGRHAHAASGTKWCRHHMPQDLRDAHPKPHQLPRSR